MSRHIALLLHSRTDPGQYYRSVLRPVRARSLVNLPADHVGGEETEIGHCPSVCAALILLCCVLPVFMYSFLVLLTHFITRSLEFSRARLQIDTDREMYRWSIPLTFLGK